MSGQIFISYRREDSSAWAGRLSDRLKNRLPSNEIFMDVDTMDPGVDFAEAVEEVVTACDVLIAVIGSRWLTSSNRRGMRRLDIPDDLVRLEIATALKRGIRVVPVLVEGATMPEAGELPDDLKALVRRNALEIGHNRFDADSEHLVNAVGRALEKAREKREEKERQEAERLQKEEQGRLRIAPQAQVPSPIAPDATSTPSAQPAADKPSAGNPQVVYPLPPRPAEAKPENPPPPSPGGTGGKSPSKQLIAVVVIAAVVLAGGLIYLATMSNSRQTRPAPPNLPAVSTPTVVGKAATTGEVVVQPSAGPIAPVGAARFYAFGVIAKSDNNPVFRVAKAGAKDEAAKLSQEKGVTVKIDWRTPNEEDPEKQAEAVKQLVDARASGIAVSCSDPNILTDPINYAVSNGVPVVCFDVDAPKSKRFAFFGMDDIYCGQKVMSELAREMGGKGVVAILAGNQKAPKLQNRVKGVEEETYKYSEINILGAFYHKETPQDAANKVEQVMQAHPEVTGWAMIGAWPLFTDYALKFAPGSVKVVAVDVLPAELGYVRAGYVQVLLAQPYYEWGATSVKLLYDNVVENKTPPSSFVNADLIPITRENVDEFAKSWEKWLLDN
jgi:ribose transport system substrate-binding protein